MGIRLKIFLGFGILASMLLLAGFISIHELTSIGKSVIKMLDDNYQSIEASNTMLEALEREDSGILLLLMGNWKEGRKHLLQSDSVFTDALSTAQNNITIEGEGDYIHQIKTSYSQYKQAWKMPIVGTNKEGNFEWYYSESHQQFIQVKRSIKSLMELNQKAMYNTSKALKDRSKRSVMPGIVAIITAVLFTLLFNYFIHHYFAEPIVQITKGVEDFNVYGKEFKVEIETEDELKRLAEAINNLLHSSHIK